MSNKIYLYPVWLRIWHGLNAVCIIILGVTGIRMQYSVTDNPLIKFETAVSLHNIVGTLIIFFYLFYLIANIISHNSKHYKIKFKGLTASLVKQGQYYISGYLKGDPKPFPISKKNKFNPLQRISYFAAMYVLIPVVIISGVALLFPEMIIEHVFQISGIRLTIFVHSLAGFFILIFLVIHLYVITIGKHPLRNFKSIVDGYHSTEDH